MGLMKYSMTYCKCLCCPLQPAINYTRKTTVRNVLVMAEKDKDDKVKYRQTYQVCHFMTCSNVGPQGGKT